MLAEQSDVRKVMCTQAEYDFGNPCVFTNQISSVIIILSLHQQLHLYFLFAFPIINTEL